MLRRPDRAFLIVISIAAAKLALNVAFAGRYGYFRDELYYLACADHLQWGYVDHPPLSIAVLKLTRLLLGDSLYAIRFPAAVAGSLTIVLAGRIARQLGGGTFAQVLAALCVAFSPVVLGNAARYFSMNAFDLLFWAGGSSVFIAILLGGSERLWLLYGVVVGLGALNKYSMLFFAAGSVGGLLLTRLRRHLLSPWMWAGGAIAALMLLPHILWELRFGWPSLEFIRNATSQKNVPLSPMTFFAEQLMQDGVGQAIVWIAGLAFVLRGKPAVPIRALAWMFAIVAVIMLAGHAKAYYLSPIFTPLLAAGAVAVESASRRRSRWIRPAVVLVVVAFGLITLPFAVPVLPIEQFIAYQRALGQTPTAEEADPVGDLPQYYSDMFGWQDMVAQVAAVYRSLPEAERAHTLIYVRDYGQAAAVDFFGRRYGLPHPICAHNNYWYWARFDDQMRTAIIVGAHRTLADNLADLTGPGRFDSGTLAATTSCEHCRPLENGRQIFVCRGPHFKFSEIWPSERFFI